MKHLLISREYPPAPGGGIGTYVRRISHLLAGAGETVHVVAPAWDGAPVGTTEEAQGRLLVHRVAFLDWRRWPSWHPHGDLPEPARRLFGVTPCPTEAFGWHAAGKVEELVASEGIDLVESQEYEAPLYRFMLRRVAGLGPSRRPPCLIHLHTPTEIIARYDDEDPDAPFHLRNSRYEEFCITGADGLLCPSRFLARQAEQRYGLASGSVRSIPLPMGDMAPVARSAETWRDGVILYVGRLEPRKGVFEWARAAVALADEFPGARFRFLGADVAWAARFDTTVGETIRRFVPARMRDRFEFPGACSREQVRAELGRARIAVVPSRWENFPNTCVEAMASGLPVVTTVFGGMAEMAEDGVTGWVASVCSPDSLASACRSALRTSPEDLAGMGARAADEIRRRCADDRVLAAHLELRGRLVERGASVSLSVPPCLLRGRSSAPVASIARDRDGLAVVVPCYNLGRYLGDCLESLACQTVRPVRVVVVDDGSTEPETRVALEKARRDGWEVVSQDNGGVVPARRRGVRELLDRGVRPEGLVFLDADDRLRPAFIERCLQVLRHAPEVGIVSCWVWNFGDAEGLWACPCPSYPYQWVTNEAATFGAIRMEAYEQAGGFRDLRIVGYEDWDLTNAVLTQGWAALTLPEILADYRVRAQSGLRSITAHGHGFMRHMLLDRFPDLVRRDAMEIARLSEAQDSWAMRQELFELRRRIGLARGFMRRPHEAIGWAARRILRKVRGE